MTETTGQAELHERIAVLLAETDGWEYAKGLGLRDMSESMQQHYDKLASAVLSVLPAPAPVSDDLLAAQLAPLEAQARAGREQQRAQHRAEVLREAADRFDTRAASVGDVSDDPAIFVAKARIHDAGVWREAATELRRLADETAPASGPGRVAGETQQAELQAADRIVAHVPTAGTDLHCLRCTPPPLGNIWTAVTAEELEDGGICTKCGTDVLIPPAAVSQPETGADQFPIVGYSGKGRVWCVKCLHPDDENAPVTTAEVDEWDLCPSCGRHVIDVAREEPTS